MSSTLFTPPANATSVDALAFKLTRQILDARLSIARAEGLCRELLMAAAAGELQPDARSAALASLVATSSPPAAPPPAPPRPAGPRRAEAVDSSEAAAVDSVRKVSERRRRMETTRQAAPRRLLQLDLAAANDELAGCVRRAW